MVWLTWSSKRGLTGTILLMRPANERCYTLTSSPIGWAHTENDPWFDSRNASRCWLPNCGKPMMWETSHAISKGLTLHYIQSKAVQWWNNMMHSLLWISTFWSLMEQFANEFYLLLFHSWKSFGEWVSLMTKNWLLMAELSIVLITVEYRYNAVQYCKILHK